MRYDVIIIGGSIAGLGLAYRLSQLGMSALVLEKETYPKRKACGEGLSYQGVQIIEDWGLGNSFHKLPHCPFHSYKVHSRYSKCLTSEIKQLNESSSSGILGIGIKREVLDELFLEALKSIKNDNVMTKSTVTKVDIESDCIKVFVGEEETGKCTKRIFEGRFLVIADGARSKTAQRMNIPYVSQQETRYASSFRLRSINILPPESSAPERDPLDSVHIILEDGIQTCITQVDKNTLNVSSLTDKSGIQKLKSETSRDSLIKRISLELGFNGEIVDQPIFIGPVNKRRRVAHFGSRVILIGDALEQLDPIGGMGMSHALISAQNAAVALKNILQGSQSPDIDLKRYARDQERSARLLRGFTCLTYLDLVRYEEFPIIRRFDNSKLSRLVAKSIQANSKLVNGPSFIRSVLSIIGSFV